jgi:hypothetical protein
MFCSWWQILCFGLMSNFNNNIQNHLCWCTISNANSNFIFFAPWTEKHLISSVYQSVLLMLLLCMVASLFYDTLSWSLSWALYLLNRLGVRVYYNMFLISKKQLDQNDAQFLEKSLVNPVVTSSNTCRACQQIIHTFTCMQKRNVFNTCFL